MLIFQNRAPADAKLGFLRVGEAAWELKIDPKMPRKKIKHIIEKRRTKREEKKSLGGDIMKSPGMGGCSGGGSAAQARPRPWG